MISETKIDESFPKGNFLIEGFSTPYRDHVICKANIPSNLLAFEDKPIESLFTELNLQNNKILINCSYNPHKSEIKKHLTALRNSLDLHSSKYEKILIFGDFIVEIEVANMKLFCKNYNLKTLIKQPPCYKNSNKPTCLDLIFN